MHRRSFFAYVSNVRLSAKPSRRKHLSLREPCNFSAPPSGSFGHQQFRHGNLVISLYISLMIVYVSQVTSPAHRALLHVLFATRLREQRLSVKLHSTFARVQQNQNRLRNRWGDTSKIIFKTFFVGTYQLKINNIRSTIQY